jgi:hypothetical protein
VPKRLFVAALLLLVVPNCFWISDLDRFHGASAGGTPATDDDSVAWDLSLTMKGLGVHLHQRVEFRVIDSENYVQARGVIEPMNKVATESVTFTLPKAIPAGNRPYRLDFYADVNGSGDFDGLDTGITHDHAWRIEPLADFPAGKLTHVPNSVAVVFTHNTVFTNIDEWPSGTVALPQDSGLGVSVNFSGQSMAAFVGKLCQVRVVEARSGHVTGLYRNPEIPAGDFVGLIPGIVEAGEDYEIFVYVDANDNGVYDNPKGEAANQDLGWRYSETARLPSPASGAGGADGSSGGAPADTTSPLVGISVDFDPTERPGVEDVGPP